MIIQRFLSASLEAEGAMSRMAASERLLRSGGGFTASMPYYARTFGLWVEALAPRGGSASRGCRSRSKAETGRPLSSVIGLGTESVIIRPVNPPLTILRF